MNYAESIAARVVKREVNEDNQDNASAFIVIASLCASITEAINAGHLSEEGFTFLMRRIGENGSNISEGKPVLVNIQADLADLVDIFADF